MTRTVLDEIVDVLADRIERAQRMFPLTLYAGRLYFCPSCEVIGATCAPVGDLVDDYECPICGAPQVALTDPGVPRQIDRWSA